MLSLPPPCSSLPECAHADRWQCRFGSVVVNATVDAEWSDVAGSARRELDLRCRAPMAPRTEGDSGVHVVELFLTHNAQDFFSDGFNFAYYWNATVPVRCPRHSPVRVVASLTLRWSISMCAHRSTCPSRRCLGRSSVARSSPCPCLEAALSCRSSLRSCAA
jgi:hypothetical protein